MAVEALLQDACVWQCMGVGIAVVGGSTAWRSLLQGACVQYNRIKHNTIFCYKFVTYTIYIYTVQYSTVLYINTYICIYVFGNREYKRVLFAHLRILEISIYLYIHGPLE